MSDEIDRAEELSDALFSFKLTEARQKANTRELQPTGLCHYCESEVFGEKLFCNVGCSSDFEYLKSRGVK